MGLERTLTFDLPLASILGVDPLTLEYPIHEYRHGPLGISVIGGYVYRGAAIPALLGDYVFGDYSTSFGTADGALYTLRETRPGKWQRFDLRLSTGGRLEHYVKGFGQDEDGELYVLASLARGPSGTDAVVFKISPVSVAP